MSGGPAAYSEQRGGHAHMVGEHVGKAITERQRRRWVELLQDAADTSPDGDSSPAAG